MKLFTAALGTETNTFSPIPTSLANFSDFYLLRPGEVGDSPLEFAAPLWVARQRASASDWEVVEGTCAFALPAGATIGQDYERLRDEILQQLADALPVDAVALGMHGAMVADGYPDCEGDMLRRVRDLVGDDVVIGLEIDPHCHLTELMVNSADVIVIFKEYPHTDFVERAEELLDILERCVNGQVKPRMSVFDCRMLSFFHTTSEPMLGFVNKLKTIEQQQPGVLSISVAHGFPWGDSAEGGTKLLVLTDDDAVLGQQLSKDLGLELFGLRGKTYTPTEDMAQGIRLASEAVHGPIVLADSSDNPGGGAPGDSTYVIQELLDQGVEDVCVGAMWDPKAVEVAFAAGIGATVQMRIGGSRGEVSGEPLDVVVTVTGLKRDATQLFAGAVAKLGDSAAVRFSGIDVVLSSLRCQAFGLELFTNVGIDPAARKMVVVKSSQHFRDAFAPIAHDIYYLDSPGALMQNLKEIKYKNLPKDIWPFVDNPFADEVAVSNE